MTTTPIDFSIYESLLAKVDAKFAEIHARQAERMRCGRGCHQCCVPDISVFALEKEFIRALILKTSGLEQKLRELEAADPHEGTRCRFLQADGGCAVYEARPLICRSHGAPIFSKEGDEVMIDACPLNFTDLVSLTELSNQDFINIDLLNTILATLNQKLDPSGRRSRLQVDEILEPTQD